MNIYPLIQLLADGEFKTGTELGNSLNISRTAVWKQIQQLEKLGLNLKTDKQKGYKLIEPLQLLNQEIIKELLKENLSQLKIKCLPSIDSTNAEAKRLLAAGEDKLLVLAEMQTDGRGRRGKEWASPFSKNIALTLGCKLDVDLAKLQGLSLAIAVEVNNCIAELGEVELGFKWPNDIYLNQKKLAGILVEVSGDFSGPFNLIIGLGLNVYKSKSYLNIDQPFTFLEEVLPKVDRNILVAKLAIQLEKLVQRFSISGFEPWQESWNKMHLWQDKKAFIIHSASLKEKVTLKGVNSLGELEVITADGKLKTINSGEVSLRLDNDN